MNHPHWPAQSRRKQTTIKAMTELSPPTDLSTWQQHTQGMSAEAILAWAVETFGDGLTFASSLGAEDQVVTDLIAQAELPISIFTLDTGRLFQETYELIQRTEERYGHRIRIMFPDRREIEEMVEKHGINLFRDSVEKRQLCCRLRKIHPLRRAFAGKRAWICGLRRDQSVTRAELQPVEWDAVNSLVKVSPLWDWSNDQVWAFVRERGVPYNPLHDKGFLSIGCASCTRAVQPGEDIRAGRWWWEEPEKKECGLHIVNGKVVRGGQD